MSTRTFVRASISGIVYLIDSMKGRVYTYNLESPIYIGDLERIPGEELVTSEGNLTGARLKFREDWKTVVELVKPVV
jgi:hypothetical protein